jgi:CRP/FNR family transcriptional regulator, anaerobic regulatory protein
MDDMLTLLHAIHPLSPELREYLLRIVKTHHFSKRAFVLRNGDVCRNIYFIRRGLLRCYYIKGETEVTAWLMKEGDVVTAVESFYDQKWSYEYIHALEETEVYYIPFQELEHIYATYPEFNFIGRVLTVKYLKFWTQQLYNIRMRSARERYEYLMKENPELIQRVPDKYLASYLGMFRETFSRMKYPI